MMIRPALPPQQYLRPPHVALVAALLLAPGTARAEPLLTRVFPPGEDACYGRVHDADEQQRVSTMHLFRAQRSDPQREQPEHPRAAQLENDARQPGASGTRWLSLLVRFKDEPGRVQRQDLECHGNGADGFRCGVECDGGSLAVTAAGEQLLVTPKQLRLQGACGASEDRSAARLSADAPLRLERRPMQACLAARVAARPSWASATPLRVRFAERNGICHGRSYDAAHLARHPQQNVAAITLRTRETVRLEDDDGIAGASFGAEIAVRTREGATARAEVTCHAHEFTFACASEDERASFDLIRDGERGVLIREANAGRRDGSANSLAPLFGVRLGEDDRVFRLAERDDAACPLR